MGACGVQGLPVPAGDGDVGDAEQPLSNVCDAPANCCTKPVVCSATLADKKLSGSLTEQIGCGDHPFVLDQTTTANIATGGITMVSSITRDGALILTTTVTLQDNVAKISASYGAAFKGITQSSFTNDGKFTIGEVNGRPIVPLPAGADPATVAFQDGLPPPVVHVNDDTKKAINYLFQLAKKDESACLGGAGLPRAPPRRQGFAQASAGPRSQRQQHLRNAAGG